MVMMCAVAVRVDVVDHRASVVLLPLPVVPVTSTRPRSSVGDLLEDRRQAELVDAS